MRSRLKTLWIWSIAVLLFFWGSKICFIRYYLLFVYFIFLRRLRLPKSKESLWLEILSLNLRSNFLADAREWRLASLLDDLSLPLFFRSGLYLLCLFYAKIFSMLIAARVLLKLPFTLLGWAGCSSSMAEGTTPFISYSVYSSPSALFSSILKQKSIKLLKLRI